MESSNKPSDRQLGYRSEDYSEDEEDNHMVAVQDREPSQFHENSNGYDQQKDRVEDIVQRNSGRRSNKKKKSKPNVMPKEESEEEEDYDYESSEEEEGVDESVKLLEFKKARKKAQEDAQALKNRIMLLEQENSKMKKKIKGTKKKAIEIMRIKNRKREKEDERKQLEKMKKEEELMKRQRIRQEKINREQKLNSFKKDQTSSSLIMAQNTKNMLKDLRETYKKKRVEEIQEVKRNAQAIKNIKILAKEKKRRLVKKKKKQAKQRYVKQIEKELNIKDDIQNQIEELKKRENELIVKLKNTGEQQNKAIFDLQKVLNGEIPTFLQVEDVDEYEKEESKKRKKRRIDQ